MLFDARLETFRSRFADVDRFRLVIERFHLYRQVVDTETVMQFGTYDREQIGMLNVLVVADMRGQCIDAGGDGPHMKVVNTADAVGLDYCLLDRVEIYMTRRTLEQDVDGFDYEPPCAVNDN